MSNTTLVWSNQSESNGCVPWTRFVYLYGHIIPAVALSIFGLTFNPLALYYFATSRNFRRSAYSYYFSAIAVVDLCRLILWYLFLLLDYKIFQLKFNYSFECSIQVYLESVASSISAWLTVALTVERCSVIYKPLQTVTDTRGKRAVMVIVCVIVISCLVNSLFLQPGFYDTRAYLEDHRMVVCYYKRFPTTDGASRQFWTRLTPDLKRYYVFFILIVRVPVPFLLLSIANIVLFVSIREKWELTSRSPGRVSLVRHGQHRQVTPMIFFSSCILLLTISPRYLLQFAVNFFEQSLHCSLIHFAPHLLKTFELFNYSFNVFVSIVSGKHGRHEFFDMLLCRSSSVRAKSTWSASSQQSSLLVRVPYRPRSSHKPETQINATHKALRSSNQPCYCSSDVHR